MTFIGQSFSFSLQINNNQGNVFGQSGFSNAIPGMQNPAQNAMMGLGLLFAGMDIMDNGQLDGSLMNLLNNGSNNIGSGPQGSYAMAQAGPNGAQAFAGNNQCCQMPQNQNPMMGMMMQMMQMIMQMFGMTNNYDQMANGNQNNGFMPMNGQLGNDSNNILGWNPMDSANQIMNSGNYGNYGSNPINSSGNNFKKGNAKVSGNVERYDSIIQQKAQKYGLDPDFVKCVIQQESGGNPNAKSHCGAMGLMQLMPGTAKDLGCANPWDPAQNIDAGCKYLSRMMKKYGGDMKLTLAAYNAGPGNVNKYGGIPPFRETQKYVANIMSNYQGLS